MYFTQDDYRKIEEWLRKRTIKDVDFPMADALTGSEKVPIVQDGKNKILSMYDLVAQMALMRLPDFFNVTVFTKKGYLSLECAIDAIPVDQRKLGLTITFHNEEGNWVIYQFKGTSVNQWNSLNYWNNIIEGIILDSLFYPDEEDITAVKDNNRSFLKFRNKEYNPEDFSGLGRVYLRKNYVGTEACAIDDEDHYSNILTQEMIREPNTIYIVQYDFDLDGAIISIPENCILWFQGGSINNGSIYLNNTAILGAWEFADMGDAKLFGTFNTGQIMTFSNESYKKKEGGYFTAGTKDSSASLSEDPKQDKETFYSLNGNAYTESTRQELRWWNGEEWVLIMDIEDYNEIISIIQDLIAKHNAEMAACYKYFKTRLSDLESKVDEKVSDIYQEITKLKNLIENIDSKVIEVINQYLQDKTLGTQSVTVNGSKYNVDSQGNITLPNYPEVPELPSLDDYVKREELGDYASSSELEDLKKRVKTIEDKLVNIQATTITTINLEPEDNEVNITIEATNIEGNPVSTEYSVDLNNNDFTLTKS